MNSQWFVCLDWWKGYIKLRVNIRGIDNLWTKIDSVMLLLYHSVSIWYYFKCDNKSAVFYIGYSLCWKQIELRGGSEKVCNITALPLDCRSRNTKVGKNRYLLLWFCMVSLKHSYRVEWEHNLLINATGIYEFKFTQSNMRINLTKQGAM